jgi:Ca-activated chloride channel family protein
MRIHFSIAGCLIALLLLAPPRAIQKQLPPPPRPQENNTAIKMKVNLVVLHATTENKKGVLVSGLGQDNFQVFEDGIAQRIEAFSHEDIPVTVGLVVDGSGSMRPKHADVVSAALTFARSSNSHDEMFVVNFNEHVSFGLPEGEIFTSQPATLERAVARSPVTGQTALYDAIAAGLDRLQRGTRDKKVLIVISDGGDNASALKLKQLITQAVQSNAVIYTIGLFDESDLDRNPGVLKQIAHATGGETYLPATIAEVVPLCAQIARDIRNQYTIAYAPTNTNEDGAFRAIEVKAKSVTGHDHIVVRTRPGYYAPGPLPESAPPKTSTHQSAANFPIDSVAFDLARDSGADSGAPSFAQRRVGFLTLNSSHTSSSTSSVQLGKPQ